MISLKAELLHTDKLDERQPDLSSCFNAKGMYVPMQFAVRLRPDIHNMLSAIDSGIHSGNSYDGDVTQAFSTYFHETVHWWQHIGSVAGFMSSMTYPSQTHANSTLLEEFKKITGLVKPITTYNTMHANEFIPTSREFQVINEILNNFYDIEFFRIFTFNPAAANEIIGNVFFESLGHIHYVAYATFWEVILSPFEKKPKFVPDVNTWTQKYAVLHEKKAKGFYHGGPVHGTDVGLLQIFEGQARFCQIHYLYFASGKELTWADFERMGMLSGEYYVTFNTFLKILGEVRPSEIDSPLVALYLAVLDVVLNPGEGFPFDITNLENFIQSVNPGYRFYTLCYAIREQAPSLKNHIKHHSNEEYIYVTSLLSSLIDSPSPLEVSAEICKWEASSPEISSLMKEEEEFEFSKINLPIRLLLSKFIKFQQDKLNSPAFFCWPGVYMAGSKVDKKYYDLFSTHQSLYGDKADGNIYPRLFPGKDEKRIKNTYDQFYAWVMVYELSRQWLVSEGDFDYDFFWLTANFSRDELKAAGVTRFEQMWGCNPNDFTIL